MKTGTLKQRDCHAFDIFVDAGWEVHLGKAIFCFIPHLPETPGCAVTRAYPQGGELPCARSSRGGAVISVA